MHAVNKSNKTKDSHHVNGQKRCINADMHHILSTYNETTKIQKNTS